MRKMLYIFLGVVLGTVSQNASAQNRPCTNCETQVLRRLDHIATDVAELKAMAESAVRYPGHAIEIRDINVAREDSERTTRQISDRYCHAIGFGRGLTLDSYNNSGGMAVTRLICYNPAAPPR